MNLDYNKMLFKMFWEQNAERSFDDFIELCDVDEYYKGIKLKDLTLDCGEDFLIANSVRICHKDFTYLCDYLFKRNYFTGLESGISFNILDHIKFEDHV